MRPDSPRLDAELLLAFVLDCPRLDLYLRADQPLNEKERGAYRELVQQRAAGCPIAYLTGEKEFWSLTLEVNKNTLIPRPDTETLVEIAVEQIRKRQNNHPDSKCLIAELGTGTGAIPLAICAELKNLHIIAVDCTEDVLQVAARNLQRHKSLLSPRNNHIELVESNLFSKINPAAKLDCIISNPPYIPRSEKSMMAAHVIAYEPDLALFVEDHHPLIFYDAIAKYALKSLKKKGKLYFEIHEDFADKIKTLLNHLGFEGVVIHHDLNKKARMASAIRA